MKESAKIPGKFHVVIVTLSDRAFNGEYEDLSGPRIRALTEEYFGSLKREVSTELILIDDDPGKLKEIIEAKSSASSVIFTTGGTGIGPRDITVETVRPLLTKEIPGVMEYIRIKYGTVKPAALLSRGVAGVIGKCLIYTLPGSLRAVNEYIAEITKTLEHSIEMLYSVDSHMK